MRSWIEGVWYWGDFGISQRISQQHGLLLEIQQLRLLLDGSNCSLIGIDSVEWKLEENQSFLIYSCYSYIAGRKIPFGPRNKFDKALQLVWKMGVSYKIKAFGWRFLINSLPTKDLLRIRGISFSIDFQKCVLCGIAYKSLEHSFLNCFVINLV
ncbi:unnamed protein product [Vicia faba]|uniref:Reverse transcriptase zinc-binding domain-containing protein n=1 Tax=Vicia faba TaxID=3906 RepID=A0AAV0YVA4_VICFA|nr:unnamed protein product [Vicia faba]